MGLRQAEPFWQALVLLATRDPSDLVVLEAIRQLAGSGAPSAAQLSGSAALHDPTAGARQPALRSASPARGAARAASLVTLRSSAGAEAAGKGLPAFSPTAQAMQRCVGGGPTVTAIRTRYTSLLVFTCA